MKVLRFVAAAAVVAAAAAPAAACPFCTSQGQTLSGEVAQAAVVLYGTLTNARLDAGGDFGAGSTDLVVETVVKPHDILNDPAVVKPDPKRDGGKILTLPRYVPSDRNNPVKFLVFCDVFKGKLDPYRGVAVKPDSRIGDYLRGALAVKDKPAAERLAYFFGYLDAADAEVSNDAYTEFGNSDYKDFRDMAAKLPADRVAKWLQDPNTPAVRFGLYGSMLGHSGQPEHGRLIRKLLDDPEKRFSSGIDGMLAGYVLLDKSAGWDYLKKLLADESRDFLVRYAGLRAVRFFYESRPDVVSKDELVAVLSPMLDQKDIADLVVEDYRKWQRWGETERVLALFDRPSHNVPIVRRSVLRFMLSAPPEQKQAAEFVARARAKDRQWVEDAEELLRLESKPPEPPKPAGKQG